MNKPAQGAQWSPSEQGMLDAKYGGHPKHHYVPLPAKAGEAEVYTMPPITWIDRIGFSMLAMVYVCFGWMGALIYEIFFRIPGCK